MYVCILKIVMEGKCAKIYTGTTMKKEKKISTSIELRISTRPRK